MNFEEQIIDKEDHRPVKNKPADLNGIQKRSKPNREGYDFDGAENSDASSNAFSGGNLSGFPGLEHVENYSPHLLQMRRSGSEESFSPFDEVLQEAWTASYEMEHPAQEKIYETGDASTLERIIGTDDRVQIQNTKGFPYRAICHLLIESKTGRRYLGTGWLVSPRTLITAGHNVFLHKEGGWAKSVIVSPGMKGNIKPFGSCKTTDFRSVYGWVKSRTPDSDYAAIRLPDRHGLNIGNNYFQVAEATPRNLKRRYLNISGYPGDKGGKTQWYHARPVKRITARRFFYTIDTMGGHSGSPVYVKAPNGSRVAYGIHAYGSSKENSATRFTSSILKNIVRWKNEGV